MSNAFNENTQTDGTFDIEDVQIDAVFQINAAGTTWGSIDGNIENQTDLKNALNSKASAQTVSEMSETVSANATKITTITATLSTFGDVVTYNVDDFATKGQGLLADSALQPNDNITELTNNAGYITSSALDGYATEKWVGEQGYLTSVGDGKTTIKVNNTAVGTITANQTSNNSINVSVPTDTTDLTNNAGYITGIDSTDVTTALGYTPQPELIAGENITINNNTISATDTTYSAGNGILINNNTIGITTTIASKTDIGKANLLIYGNSTPLGTFSANATSAVTVTVPIPTTATEVGALPSDTTIDDLTTSAQLAALNSGATSTNISAISTNTSAIADINDLIPSGATTANQLATEGFVNSSISTNTANFIGTFNSVAELEAYSGTLTNNDYAFVATTDSAGNTLYDRYKWNGTEWLFEYELNNSSFTSDQWAAINSGITTSDVSAIAANTSAISNKQDILSAGSNITISGNTISATDTTYEAGSGISITNGTISATSSAYSLPTASTSVLGGVMVGNNLSIQPDGTLDAIDTTYSAGENITITNGTISATDTTYNPGNGINITNGTISVTTTIASKTDIGDADITIQRNGTAIGTINTNATSSSTINISVPTTATEVGALPSDTVIGDGAVIFQKNGSAISTITANQTSTTTVNFTIPTQASDINALPDTTTIGDGATTITVNSTAVGTITANQTSSGAINVSVPTNTNELTNGAGFITSSALTPYQLITQDILVPSIDVNNTVYLSDNTAYKISLIAASTPSLTIVLPTISTVQLHQIFVQLNMRDVVTVDLGTSYYFNSTAPDLSAVGAYNLYYEYDTNKDYWVVGCIPKGAAS